MLFLYDWNAQLTNNRLPNNGTALLNAIQPKLERQINGDDVLSFSLPPTDKAWDRLREECLIKHETQVYRIKFINKGEIKAYPIHQDAGGYHKQNIPDMIGEGVTDILNVIFGGTGITVVTTTGQGHTVIGNNVLTDFFEQSKITPLGALEYLVEQLKNQGVHAELWYDNKKLCLVESLGRNLGQRIDLRLNASDVDSGRDSSGLVTRLYPYGASDLHIGNVAISGYYDEDGTRITDSGKISRKEYCYHITGSGNQYIESPYIDSYPIREGFTTFSDVEEPEELLKKAAHLFSISNPERIDVPKYSFSVDMAIGIGTDIQLGDIVTINDIQFDIKKKERVISTVEYLDEPSKNSLTVGQAPETINDILAKSSQVNNNIITDTGKVKVSWLENIKSVLRTAVNETIGKLGAVIHNKGDIWVNPDNENQALAIIGGKLAIANGKTAQGDYNWTTFGDWTGFTADVLNAGTLNTANINIQGSNQAIRLLIDNNLIRFKQRATTRAEIGYTGSEYVFNLYDEGGNPTLTLDSFGNATLKGVLDTTKTNGDTGYVIENENIIGQKYEAGEYIRDGFASFRGQYDNNDGIHLLLYDSGVEYIHLDCDVQKSSERGRFSQLDGRKRCNIATNCTDKSGEGANFDSVQLMQLYEGSINAATGTVNAPWLIMRGNWDIDNNVFVSYVGQSGGVRKAFTGNVTVGERTLHFINGILME